VCFTWGIIVIETGMLIIRLFAREVSGTGLLFIYSGVQEFRGLGALLITQTLLGLILETPRMTAVGKPVDRVQLPEPHRHRLTPSSVDQPGDVNTQLSPQPTAAAGPTTRMELAPLKA
jgi:hypothetical protein